MKSIIIAMISFRSYWKHYPISNYFMTSDDYTRGEMLGFFCKNQNSTIHSYFSLSEYRTYKLSMIVQASYQMLTFGWKTF